MILAGVAKQLTSVNLQLLKQVGINDLVYYNMLGMPTELEALRATQQFAAQAGLQLSVIEGGPPIDKIVLAKEGRDEQIEEYKRAIENMGKLGIRVLCYNFMPQVSDMAMVVRTNVRHAERGGALTSQFRLADVNAQTMPHKESATTDEQMWDNLEYFLRRIVPVAEAAEVKLALHPDDPPLSPLCRMARIVRSVENYDRLLSLVDSPVNGITLCQGCFAEMGCDIPDVIRHFGDRTHFVHFRDIDGDPDDFYETFPDNGPRNMIDVLRTYQEVNYQGFARVDHVPLLATEPGDYDGYGMHGHIFAIGYWRGLMQGVFGRDSR